MAGRDVTRTCVYSFSGGTASLAADLVGSAGLKLATFEPATSAALTGAGPGIRVRGQSGGPHDQGIHRWDLNRAVFELICNDPNVGSVLFAMPADYGENTVAVSRDAVEIARSTGTLLIPVWMSPRRGDGYQVLHAAGMTPIDGVHRAVKALRRFAEWRGTRRAADETGAPGRTPTRPRPAPASSAARADLRRSRRSCCRPPGYAPPWSRSSPAPRRPPRRRS